MDLKLNGKVALVTGSTAGIGFAIAESLAREGAHVYVNGRTQQRVDAAIAAIRSHAAAPRSMASRRTFRVQRARRRYCETARGRCAGE